MRSWRDTASASAQEDLDGLLNLVLPLAQELLGKNGQFYPFGATVPDAGEAALIGEDHGLGEYPQPDEALDDLYDETRENAAAIRAAAFVSDVQVNGSDAIRVELEHRDGVALTVLVPYTPLGLKRFPRLGVMSASPGESRVWATD